MGPGRGLFTITAERMRRRPAVPSLLLDTIRDVINEGTASPHRRPRRLWGG